MPSYSSGRIESSSNVEIVKGPATLQEKLEQLLKLQPLIAVLRIVIAFAQKGVSTIRTMVREEVIDLVEGVEDASDDFIDIVHTVIDTGDDVLHEHVIAVIPQDPSWKRTVSDMIVAGLRGMMAATGPLGAMVNEYGHRATHRASQDAFDDAMHDIYATLEEIVGSIESNNLHATSKLDKLETRLNKLLERLQRVENRVDSMKNEILLEIDGLLHPKPTQFSVQDVRSLATASTEWRWCSRENPKFRTMVMPDLTITEREPFVLPPPEDLQYGSSLDVSSSGITRTQSGLVVIGTFKARHCPRLVEMEGEMIIGKAFSVRGTTSLRCLPHIHRYFIRDMDEFDASDCPQLTELSTFSDDVSREEDENRKITIDNLWLINSGITRIPDNVIARRVYMRDVGQDELMEHCEERRQANDDDAFFVVTFTQEEWEERQRLGY